jgi:O-antigen/teichoic acid export membrane protein
MMDTITPAVVTPQTGLLVTLCVASLVHTLSIPYVIVLSGLGLLRAQLVSAVATAGVNLALSVVLASWIGLIGPALAAALCLTFITLVPMTVVIRKRLRSDAEPAHPARSNRTAPT